MLAAMQISINHTCAIAFFRNLKLQSDGTQVPFESEKEEEA